MRKREEEREREREREREWGREEIHLNTLMKWTRSVNHAHFPSHVFQTFPNLQGHDLMSAWLFNTCDLFCLS